MVEAAAPAAMASNKERRFRPSCDACAPSLFSAIASFFRVRAIAGIGWRTVRIPAASLAQIADQIGQIGFAECVFVCGHSRAAISNFVLYSVFVRCTPG